MSSGHIISGVKTRSLFDTNEKEALISRIVMLYPGQHPLWGKMTLLEMLDHCALALEMALKPMPKDTCSPEACGAFWLWEKPDSQAERLNKLTLKKMTRLINLIKGFDCDNIPGRDYRVLGSMLCHEYGAIHFTHIDHHLTQFGK